MGHLGFAEYHPPPADTLPLSVTRLAAPAIIYSGRTPSSGPESSTGTPPDSAVLFVRPAAGPFYRGYRMRPAGRLRVLRDDPGRRLSARGRTIS